MTIEYDDPKNRPGDLPSEIDDLLDQYQKDNDASQEVESEIPENPEKRGVNPVDKPLNMPSIPTAAAIMGETERIRHSIDPIRDNKNKVVAYKVISPSGKQEFEVSADSMEMKILHDTIIGNESDAQEVLSLFDLVYKVKTSMKAIGVKEHDIPTDPEEIAEKARLLIVKGAEIQKARTEIEMENATQAFLRLYTKVMSGDKKDYSQLNPDQKEQVKTFGDILMVHMLKKMGINEEETAVAQTIMKVDRLLRERKATAIAMEWQGRGMAFGNAVGNGIGGFLSATVGHISEAAFGKEKAQGGLVGAAKDVSGEIVDGIVSGTGEKVDQTVEWVKGQFKKN